METKIIDSLKQAQAGIALFDADEQIVFANPAWEQLISGVSEEDLIFNETELPDGGMISVCFVKPQTPQAKQHDLGDSDTPPKTGTVIIADDSESNRMVARRILQAEGYGIVEASNGQTVLNMLKRGVTADLILMDVEMPDMDGLHTTRRIRHMNGPVSRTPIIALSAHQSRDWNIIARQSGVDDFINKPIQRQKLIDTMEELITRRPGVSDGAPDTPTAPKRRKSARIGRPHRPESLTGPVLDVRILEQLYTDAGDEGAGCGIEIFINETETRLVKIDKALSEDDLTTVRNEVHALKSTSGTFGLRQLSELCETTQTVFEDNDPDENRLLSLSRQVVQLAPTALTALNLYRRSRDIGSAPHA